MSYQNIMFDLDGTITDSGQPIIESVEIALAHFGFVDQPIEKLRKFVGPSLMYSFTEVYGLNEEDATEAVRLYRAHYESGAMYNVTLYDGIVDVIKANAEEGRSNILVTSKPLKFAEKIMEKIGLAPYFTYYAGPDPSDPSSDKSRLINQALEHLNLDPKTCIMIGDTKFDIEGAHGSGVDSIAVTYGFGTRDELEAAKPNYILDNAIAILDVVR